MTDWQRETRWLLFIGPFAYDFVDFRLVFQVRTATHWRFKFNGDLRRANRVVQRRTIEENDAFCRLQEWNR